MRSVSDRPAVNSSGSALQLEKDREKLAKTCERLEREVGGGGAPAEPARDGVDTNDRPLLNLGGPDDGGQPGFILLGPAGGPGLGFDTIESDEGSRDLPGEGESTRASTIQVQESEVAVEEETELAASAGGVEYERDPTTVAAEQILNKIRRNGFSANTGVAGLLEHLELSLEDDGQLEEAEYASTKELLLPAFLSLGSQSEIERLQSRLLEFAETAPGHWQSWLSEEVDAAAEAAAGAFAANAALDRVLKDANLTTGEVQALVTHLRDSLADDAAMADAEYADTKDLLEPAFRSLVAQAHVDKLSGALEEFAENAPGHFQTWLVEEVEEAAEFAGAGLAAKAALDALNPSTPEVQVLVDHFRQTFDEGRLEETAYGESKDLIAAAFRSLRTDEETEALRAGLIDFAENAPGSFQTWLVEKIEELADSTAGFRAASVSLEALSSGGHWTGEVRELIDHLQASLDNDAFLDGAEYLQAKDLLLAAFRSLQSRKETEQLEVALLEFAANAPGKSGEWLEEQIGSAVEGAGGGAVAACSLDAIERRNALATDEVGALLEHLRSSLDNDGRLDAAEYNATTHLLTEAFHSIHDPSDREALRASLAEFAENAPGEYQAWLGEQIDEAFDRSESYSAASLALDALETSIASGGALSTAEVRDLVDHLRDSLDNDRGLSDVEYSAADPLVRSAFASVGKAKPRDQLYTALIDFAESAPGQYQSWLVEKIDAALDDAQTTAIATDALKRIEGSQRLATAEVQELVDFLRSALENDLALDDGEYRDAAELLPAAFASLATAHDVERLQSLLLTYAESAPGKFQTWLQEQIDAAAEEPAPSRLS